MKVSLKPHEVQPALYRTLSKIGDLYELKITVTPKGGEAFNIAIGFDSDELTQLQDEAASLFNYDQSKENEMILHEVRDHATYWHSDMAKRITVEKHLGQKGIEDVESKIDRLIKAGKLILIPKPRGDYLKEKTT